MEKIYMADIKICTELPEQPYFANVLGLAMGIIWPEGETIVKNAILKKVMVGNYTHYQYIGKHIETVDELLKQEYICKNIDKLLQKPISTVPFGKGKLYVDKFTLQDYNFNNNDSEIKRKEVENNILTKTL